MNCILPAISANFARFFRFHLIRKLTFKLKSSLQIKTAAIVVDVVLLVVVVV
jgi:hypothetical protein